MKHYNWLIAFLLFFVLSGCQDTYSEHQPVSKPLTWVVGEKHTFRAQLDNVEPTYDIVINLRHTPDVKFTDFDLVLVTTGPDGKSETKDHLLPVKRPNSNELLGGCSGHYCDTETVIVPNYKFPASGVYTFEMTSKAKEDLLGMIEIGLIIREAKKA